MKKIWGKVGAGAALALLGGVLSAYAYLHSDRFTASIAEKLSAVLGESVELGNELNIDSVYPTVTMTLPNAKLRASEQANGIQRGRLQGLQVSLNPQFLFSGGSNGRVDLTAQSMTLIIRSGEFEVGGSSRFQVGSALSDQIDAATSRLSGLDVTLSISEFTVLSRNEKQGNRTHRLSEVVMRSESGSVFAASADVLDEDEVLQVLDAQLVIESSVSQAGNSPVVGTLAVALNAVADHAHSHTFESRWEVLDNVVNLEALEYTSDKAQLKGDIAIQYESEQIFVNSALELRRWDVTSSQSGVPESARSSSADRLFSYDLFGNLIPDNLVADVKLHLGAIRMHGQPIVNGELQIKVAQGVMDISSDELFLMGGEADFSVELDNSLSQLLGLKLKLEIDDVQLKRVRSADGSDTIFNRGEADIILALRGSGPSLGHLVATLDGYVIAAVDDARIKQKYSTLIDVGVVSWAVDRLSLLSKEGSARRNSSNLSDPLRVDCASLRLYINDGRVEVSNGAIIEFPDNVLFSSGYIDLQSERLGFAFRSKSRSMFDWSAMSIVKYAEIGGSLSNPSISLNASELAKKGVLSASSVAWGPLPKLVYSLAESGVNNMNSMQCEPHIN